MELTEVEGVFSFDWEKLELYQLFIFEEDRLDSTPQLCLKTSDVDYVILDLNVMCSIKDFSGPPRVCPVEIKEAKFRYL